MKLDTNSPHQRAGKLHFAGPLCALGLAGQYLSATYWLEVIDSLKIAIELHTILGQYFQRDVLQ